jgi:hypothetical protein
VTRVSIGAAGLALAAYGGWRLLALGTSNLLATLRWLVGGVVLHDALLAPLTILVAVVALRLVPRRRLSPWAVALIVLAPVTILSIPVLGRFGARSTEPSLLDRHYWLGWFALVALVGLAILVGTFARRVAIRATSRRGATAGGDRGSGDGRR